LVFISIYKFKIVNCTFEHFGNRLKVITLLTINVEYFLFNPPVDPIIIYYYLLFKWDNTRGAPGAKFIEDA